VVTKTNNTLQSDESKENKYVRLVNGVGEEYVRSERAWGVVKEVVHLLRSPVTVAFPQSLGHVVEVPEVVGLRRPYRRGTV
jgi:hypothetical protein